jgi:hypoxanthine-DNA glycosylase
MLETHPYPPFVPKEADYLLLGSFPGILNSGYHWYYSSPRNQFWPILERVYGLKLSTKKSKQQLFTRLHLAVTDIIYQCRRLKNNNSDTNLTDIVFNTSAISEILAQNKISVIYFSGRFVENKFRKLFKNIPVRMITLPSPSPRYAKMDLAQKIKIYKSLLPELK